ncbi:uncharacterized protein VTP21DRAFT_5770 [Calcarisporiella thermophila]|uniref:uncharacterized protein n=1 Tax=Calcarisporiella thermophila TaxID=911321 RepID=UPI003743B4ED
MEERETPASHTPLLPSPSTFKNAIRERFRSFSHNFTLQELSGGLGDLGTLIPILISLVVTNNVSLTSSLFFGGLWNVVSGVQFRIPMCVQPMKAIASVALATKMSPAEIGAAGLGVSAVVAFLGLTRTIRLVSHWTPIAVIKGIQLGVGLNFVITSVDLVKQSNSWTQWHDNYEWALVSFLFVIFNYYNTRVPSALVLFALGLILAGVRLATIGGDVPSIGIYNPFVVTVPTATEFKNAFLNASLGQIPLTTLNSVIALAVLSQELFPKRPAGTVSIATSIGFMNIIGCFLGSIPYCHGSGGLAGQYRFGARSEVSIIILGIIKIIIGIVFGPSLLGILKVFPRSILGVMLFVSGVELAMAARSVNRGVEGQRAQMRNFLVMILTGGLLIGFKNDGIGFVGGCISAVLLYLQAKWFGTAEEEEETQTDTRCPEDGPSNKMGEQCSGKPQVEVVEGKDYTPNENAAEPCGEYQEHRIIMDGNVKR